MVFYVFSNFSRAFSGFCRFLFRFYVFYGFLRKENRGGVVLLGCLMGSFLRGF